LSPRAVERLENYTPPWPLPKLFRLTAKGKLNEGVFKGETINTPSMLCVEDALDSLRWAESVGGLRGLIARSEANLAVVADWIEGRNWIDFLAEQADTRSCTSVCLKLTAPWVTAMPIEAQWAVARRVAALLDAEGVAYDIAAHRDSPPGLRVWTGATIETANVVALLPWLDWAYATAAAEHAPARAAE
jgi:phosphoserine aminotransferase